MTGRSRLDRWWDGLSEEERADAVAASETGEPSDSTLSSLEAADLLSRSQRRDRTIPDEVDVFLKARH